MRLKRWFVAAGLLAGLGVMAHGAASAVYAGYNRTGGNDVPFATGFDGGLDEWAWLGARQLCCDHSAVIVDDPVRSGNHALLVTLDRGDPLVRGSKRAEFRLKSVEYDKVYRYSFSTFLPEDWVVDDAPVTLAQWHNVKDMAYGEGGMSPPLRLIIQGDEISVAVRWDEHPISRGWLRRGESDQEKVLWTGMLEPGRWNDWSFDVRWSFGDDGLVRVYKDGDLLVDYQGPNTYNDFIAPYFKMGIYVPVWKRDDKRFAVTRRTAVFDAVEVREIEETVQAVSQVEDASR